MVENVLFSQKLIESTSLVYFGNQYIFIYPNRLCLFFFSFILAGRSCPFKKRMGNLVIEFVCKGLVLADGRLL